MSTISRISFRGLSFGLCLTLLGSSVPAYNTVSPQYPASARIAGEAISATGVTSHFSPDENQRVVHALEAVQAPSVNTASAPQGRSFASDRRGALKKEAQHFIDDIFALDASLRMEKAMAVTVDGEPLQRKFLVRLLMERIQVPLPESAADRLILEAISGSGLLFPQLNQHINTLIRLLSSSDDGLRALSAKILGWMAEQQHPNQGLGRAVPELGRLLLDGEIEARRTLRRFADNAVDKGALAALLPSLANGMASVPDTKRFYLISLAREIIERRAGSREQTGAVLRAVVPYLQSTLEPQSLWSQTLIEVLHIVRMISQRRWHPKEIGLAAAPLLDIVRYSRTTLRLKPQERPRLLALKQLAHIRQVSEKQVHDAMIEGIASDLMEKGLDRAMFMHAYETNGDDQPRDLDTELVMEALQEWREILKFLNKEEFILQEIDAIAALLPADTAADTQVLKPGIIDWSADMIGSAAMRIGGELFRVEIRGLQLLVEKENEIQSPAHRLLGQSLHHGGIDITVNRFPDRFQLRVSGTSAEDGQITFNRIKAHNSTAAHRRWLNWVEGLNSIPLPVDVLDAYRQLQLPETASFDEIDMRYHELAELLDPVAARDRFLKHGYEGRELAAEMAALVEERLAIDRAMTILHRVYFPPPAVPANVRVGSAA